MPEEPTKPTEKTEPRAYDLEPIAPAPGVPTPNLGREGLIDDFDEDADFDRDPEVDRALGKTPPAPPPVAPEAPRELLVVEGRGGVEPIAMAGGIVAVIAVAIAAGTTPTGRVPAGIGNLFFTIVHTLTGLASLAIAAHLQGCRPGRWSLAAARMLLAVSIFQFINGITLPSLGIWGRILLTPAAAGAYFLALWALFGWKRDRALVVAGCHAALAVIAWILLAVHAWIESGLSRAAATPGAGA